jgi:ribosomal protein S18 acetylase RimI-like enzyme
MKKTDIEIYVEIARVTGAFKNSELDVLREVIQDSRAQSCQDYLMLDERSQDGAVLGFVILGSTSMTEFTWDVYWLVVNKDFHRRGIGKQLIKKTEQLVAQKFGRAVLRVEASGRPENLSVLNFYRSAGFVEAGRIPDFYSRGDDLVVFYKSVSVQKNKEEAPVEETHTFVPPIK